MRSRLLHRGREGSGYERTLSPHVVPANAGTHNHRRAWLRRQLPQRLKRDHAVWVPAFAGTTGWSGRKGDVMDAISLSTSSRRRPGPITTGGWGYERDLRVGQKREHAAWVPAFARRTKMGT